MDENLEISLIICTRNRDLQIVDVLNSIAGQDFDKSKFEVLILDQSTNAKTQQVVEKYSDYKYIKLNSTGIAISRNEGIKYSQGKILVYVDDDVFFEKNYLSKIFDFFQNSDLEPDMIGGKTELQFEVEKPEWMKNELLGILAGSDYGDDARLYDGHIKHVPYTCNMAIKRDCITAVGGFSEFFKINEDVFFAQKIKEKGFKIAYNPKMKVVHKIPETRMSIDYYRARYFEHGLSDAFLYFFLNEYEVTNVPAKIFLHSQRLLSGLVLQNFKNNLYEKYYQNLRIYYNLGYIKSLLQILVKGRKIKNENS